MQGRGPCPYSRGDGTPGSPLEGEPPFDIFVRWSSIASTGIRIATRADELLANDRHSRNKGVGILWTKPNIKCRKDRTKEPERS